MRAALFDLTTRRFHLEDIPDPNLPADHVLLRVEEVGICGSDLHLLRHGLYAGDTASGPQVLGHEFSAIIEEIGPDVRDTRLHVGDRVAIEPTVSCGRCEWCRAGRENICPHHHFRGMPPHSGALLEYLAMPPGNVFPVPPGVTPDGAMLAEPLAIAIHTVRIGSPKPGQTAAVVGCGPIGLLVCNLLTLSQTQVILAVDPIPERRAIALECGAENTLSPGEHTAETLFDLTSKRLVDVVFEVAGTPEALRLSMDFATPGGTLVYTGIHPGDMEIDFTHARRKEMVWKWVRRTVNAYPRALELLDSGDIDPGRFVTHHWPLERVGEAFRAVDGYRDGVIKGAVEVSTAP